jgi:hypothetical protein
MSVKVLPLPAPAMFANIAMFATIIMFITFTTFTTFTPTLEVPRRNSRQPGLRSRRQMIPIGTSQVRSPLPCSQRTRPGPPRVTVGVRRFSPNSPPSPSSSPLSPSSYLSSSIRSIPPWWCREGNGPLPVWASACGGSRLAQSGPRDVPPLPLPNPMGPRYPRSGWRNVGEGVLRPPHHAGTARISAAVSAMRSTCVGSISGGIWRIASWMPISRSRPMKSRSASGESQGRSSGRIAGT